MSQFIKQKKPELQTIAVEPQEQMLLTEAKGGVKIGDQGPHKIQGMGAVSFHQHECIITRLFFQKPQNTNSRALSLCTVPLCSLTGLDPRRD